MSFPYSFMSRMRGWVSMNSKFSCRIGCASNSRRALMMNSTWLLLLCAFFCGGSFPSAAAAQDGWTLGERTELKGQEPFYDPKTVMNPGSAAFDLADWDGDGLPDLVLKDYGTPGDLWSRMPIKWFRNTGTRTAPKFGRSQVLLHDSLKGEFLCVDDVDRDGKADLFLPGLKNRVAFNRGTPEQPRLEIVSIETQGYDIKEYGHGQGPMLIDWDGDGKRDLIAARVHKNHAYFHRNVGDDKKPLLAAPVALLADGAELLRQELIPYPADVDGDGSLDLVFSVFRGSLFVCRNTAGKGKPPVLGQPVPLRDSSGPIENFLKGRANIIRVADLNGDGIMDLVFVGESSKQNFWLWWGKRS